MIDCGGTMEKEYFEMLMAGLEDAVAFVEGDTSRGQVIVREIPDTAPVPDCKEKLIYMKYSRTQ